MWRTVAAGILWLAAVATFIQIFLPGQLQLPSWCCLHALPGGILALKCALLAATVWITHQWLGPILQVIPTIQKPWTIVRWQRQGRCTSCTSSSGSSNTLGTAQTATNSARSTKSSFDAARVSLDLRASGFTIQLLQCSVNGAAQIVHRMARWPSRGRKAGNMSGIAAAAAAGINSFIPEALSIFSTSGAATSCTRRSIQKQSPSMCRRLSLYGTVGARAMQAYSDMQEHQGVVLVLYVDKNPVDQAIVTMLLGSKPGFKVVTANSGRAALEFVFSGSHLLDIVLFDTLLPDMKVTEACRILRGSFSPIELPIVLVSGRSGETDALAALERGVNDFIIKPLRQLELMARINSQVMIKRSIRREAESRSHYNLLVQVLPPHIIRRLAQGQAYIPEQHEQVTILFSDIVGFTELCSQWPTQQVVAMLDMMFSSFDDLCDRHGVFKVETIGDAYMAACGHEGCLDHALRMAAMAVDMLAAVLELQQLLGSNVRIRIGMHTGSALSGVVGKRRPRYCFFGDTVNTASRMESTGYPMTVHISDACKCSMLAASISTAAAAALVPAATVAAAAAAVAAAVNTTAAAPVSPTNASNVHLVSQFFLPTPPASSSAASSSKLPAAAAAGTAAAGADTAAAAASTGAGSSFSEAAGVCAVKPAASGTDAVQNVLCDDDGKLNVLPWEFIDLGCQHVKGKGSMNTHLLKVGEWEAAVSAVQAKRATEQQKQL